MGVQITYNGQPLNVGIIEIDNDVPVADVDMSNVLTNAITGEMTLMLDDTYFKAQNLARMLDKHAPKKAKQIRRMVERHNPLRVLGLL